MFAVCVAQGRTGVGVCSYLLYSGMFLRRPDGTPVASGEEMGQACLDYFLRMRGEGINQVSQERTVKYFAKV